MYGCTAVYCWGWNSEGQLGLGHTHNTSLPQLVEDPLLDQEHIIKVPHHKIFLELFKLTLYFTLY
jgi:alpha-tubulin suppressor-like RCC1 family protein